MISILYRGRVQSWAVLTVSLLVLAACSSADSKSDHTHRYNRPSADPARMSSDTLCYRAAGAKKNQAIQDEIRARRLNCRAILESDPLLQNGRY